MFCRLCMVIVRLLAREINAHFKEMSVKEMCLFSGSCASELFFLNLIDFLKFDF